MKIKSIVALAAFLTIFGINTAKSQSLSDILGGLLGGQQESGQQNGNSQGGLGSALGNLLEGVFSSSDISVADMAGDWTAEGPAVCFQSEGFLKQAGGKAAAAAIETKLQPYYKQYGLTGSRLSVQKDGTFTLVTGKLRLNGTITRDEKAQQGIFIFNFTVMGTRLAGVTAYVEKTSRSMDVMFDATKLKKLMSTIGQFSGITTVKALTELLDSYDGLCVGFNFKSNTAGGNGTDRNTQESGLDLLRGILNGGSRQ